MDDKEKQIKDALDYVAKKRQENQTEGSLPEAVNPQPVPDEKKPRENAPRKSRKSAADYVSADECVSMGKGMLKSGILSAIALLALNLIVFFWFDKSWFALYVMNAGFFVVRPFFKFFDKFAVEVTDLKTGERWIETKGFWGIVVGLAVLSLITVILRSWASELFPSFGFIHDGIYVAGSLWVSGRYILRNIRNAIFGARIFKAGKNALKDPAAPSADYEVDRLAGLFFRNSVIMIVVSVLLCGLTVFAQYVHLWILAPRLEKELDILAAYSECEDVLPFSVDTIKDAKGEFAFYSTRYNNVSFDEEIEQNGTLVHYTQGVDFEYDYANKKWVVVSAGYTIDVKSLNVSGVFSVDGVYDCIDEIENASFVLQIDSLNTETAVGTLTVKNGDQIVYTSPFSSTEVLVDDGIVSVTAILDTMRNDFFGMGFGYNELSFTYSVADDTVVTAAHYEATLTREAGK